MTLTELTAWKDLEKNYAEIRGETMRDMFAADPNRFEEFSVSMDGLLLDYSKNRINGETMKQLIELAKEAGLDAIEVFYPAHTYTMKQELLKIARKYDLFATGGSDYHGPSSGRNSTPGMSVPQPYYDRLLSKLLNK